MKLMRKLNRRSIAVMLVCLLAVTILSCCQKPSNQKRYELKGKVVSVNKSESTVTISHEDIAGYMPGMTMPFKIKDRPSLEILGPGDQVSATLVVDDTSTWLEDLV